MTSPIETVEIDDSPAAVLDAMTRGMFHSHFDGKWRFTSNGGGKASTVYVNDPTAKFTHRAEFDNGIAVAAIPELGLYAHIHGDGTRGMRIFKRDTALTLNALYTPRNNGERQIRAWLLDNMQDPSPVERAAILAGWHKAPFGGWTREAGPNEWESEPGEMLFEQTAQDVVRTYGLQVEGAAK